MVSGMCANLSADNSPLHWPQFYRLFQTGFGSKKFLRARHDLRGFLEVFRYMPCHTLLDRFIFFESLFTLVSHMDTVQVISASSIPFKSNNHNP